MIIKALLFVIVLIFVYETFRKLTRIKEEYFEEYFQIDNKSHYKPHHTPPFNEKELFVSLGTDPEQNDIAKTIAINCANPHYPQNKGLIMSFGDPDPEELDTPEYARFKPLEYDPSRLYYWRRDILIPEGMRRNADDDKEIASVKARYDVETEPDKKQILEDELKLFNWRQNIGSIDNRSMRDIVSDYYPSEIGMSRIWREPHSHIRDYSKSLNYGYKTYPDLGSENRDNTSSTTQPRHLKLLAELRQNMCSGKCIIPGTVIGYKDDGKENSSRRSYSNSGLILTGE